jgi:Zn-dependent protease with chaperone function
LIVLAAVLALGAVLVLVAAIFRKLPKFSEFSGQLIGKEAAPMLWQRVTQMAEKLGIAPPDSIFVGIDDNFFVTEHPVKVGDKEYKGRTLFASLSLLKTLSRSEADAVLAHELGHFSGEDTLFSRRISPMLGKYSHYLEALHKGGISRPIFHFMFFFWNLYQFSLNKLRRDREFRADRIGAEMTTPADAGEALVKIAAYCHYRAKVQNQLFEKDENVETMDVFQRIERGFPDFMTACASSNELAESDTPHPFDTHPPLADRIRNLGLDPQAILKAPASLPAPGDSWFSAIDGAETIEAQQWKAFEELFHKAHQQTLAWRFEPQGEVEIQHVVKFFPEKIFINSKGLTATLDFEKVRVSDWESPLPFSNMIKCRLEESLGRKKLVIEYSDHSEKKQKQTINYPDFKCEGAAFLPAFQNYYSRYLTAKQYKAQKSAPAPETQIATPQ